MHFGRDRLARSADSTSEDELPVGRAAQLIFAEYTVQTVQPEAGHLIGIFSRRSVPAHDKSAADRYVVLPTRNICKVVGWSTCVEVTRLASKGDPAPDVNVDTGAEIENPASKLSRGRIGLTIQPGRTLLIVGVTTACHGVR
jgi:hypothetical protein